MYIEDLFVSVVLPTYNRAYVIMHAISSVLAQTYRRFELIIVDDGSEDDTEKFVKKVRDDRIHYIKYVPNKGASYARNIGIEAAKGDVIAFIDSDNIWYPAYLQSRVDCFRENPDAMLVFGRELVFQRNGDITVLPGDITDILADAEGLKKHLLVCNIIDTNAACVKRECLKKFGGFDGRMKRLQDWELFLRIVYGNNQIVFCRDVLVENRRMADSISEQEELFWPARLMLLKEYIEQIRHYRYLPKVVQSIIEFLRVNKARALNDLSGILDEQEMADVEQILFNDGWYVQQRIQAKKRRIDSTIGDWVCLCESGDTVTDRLLRMGYHRIAIYGYGELGKILLGALGDAGNIAIRAVIDRNPALLLDRENIPLFHSVESIPDVDAVVVTAIFDYEQIASEIQNKIGVETISIETLIYKNNV